MPMPSGLSFTRSAHRDLNPPVDRFSHAILSLNLRLQFPAADHLNDLGGHSACNQDIAYRFGSLQRQPEIGFFDSGTVGVPITVISGAARFAISFWMSPTMAADSAVSFVPFSSKRRTKVRGFSGSACIMSGYSR